MINQLRILVIRLLTSGLLLVPLVASAQDRPPLAEKTAKEFGIDSWGKIDALRYTFNLDLGAFKLSRTWTWEIKTGRVTYESKDKSGQPVKVSYLRPELATQSAQVKDEIEPGFVNDQYWLLFPFHVIWDSTPTVTDKGMQKLPLGKGAGNQLVVKYPADVGYTPGDTWELFIGPDNRVKVMVYHRGGPKKPTLLTVTWAGYKKAGPLLVATDHRGIADGKPGTVTFTNVAVKLAGADAWMDAQ